MKKRLKKIINRRFPDERFKKIILFKNPDEFKHIFIERVNPTHVGILWGRRKKNLNKGNSYIRLGKVYFMSIPIIIGLSVIAYSDMWLLVFTGVYILTISSILSWFLFKLPFVLSKRFTPCQTF